MHTRARPFAIACAAGALMAAAMGGMGLALADSPHSFSANIAGVTNYLFRGVSQTDNGPAVQGGFDYTYKPYGLYAGVWGSNVSSAGYAGASMELDLYAGWRPTWDKFSFDLGYIRYQYPTTDFDDNNTNEFYGGLSYDVMGYFTPSFKASYSDDWFGDGDSWYYDLGVAMPLPYDFTLLGHYGWNRFNGDLGLGDYEDYSVGLSREFGGFGFKLSWIDRTDTGACASPFQCGSTTIFAISKSF